MFYSLISTVFELLDTALCFVDLKVNKIVVNYFNYSTRNEREGADFAMYLQWFSDVNVSSQTRCGDINVEAVVQLYRILIYFGQEC